MSTPPHVLLKADPRLEGDVSMVHQHVLRQAVFLEVLATVFALFWQTGMYGERQ